MKIPTNLPRAQDPPEHDTQPSSTTAHTAEQPQAPDEEARDILAKAIRNQAEDVPSTRRAAIRTYKYLHATGRQHGPHFFPSNARWLSPGRLSSRKDNCIVQIHRINAVATLIIMTM